MGKRDGLRVERMLIILLPREVKWSKIRRFMTGGKQGIIGVPESSPGRHQALTPEPD